MKCAQCGASVPADAKFCTTCGTTVERVAPTPPGPGLPGDSGQAMPSPTLSVADDPSGRKRNPWAVWGLSYFTLGIYAVWWYYEINKTLRDDGEEVDPLKAVLALTLGMAVVIPPFVSLYNTGERIRRARRRRGLTDSSVGWIGLLLVVFGSGGGVAYLQWKLNDLWSADR